MLPPGSPASWSSPPQVAPALPRPSPPSLAPSWSSKHSLSLCSMSSLWSGEKRPSCGVNRSWSPTPNWGMVVKRPSYEFRQWDQKAILSYCAIACANLLWQITFGHLFAEVVLLRDELAQYVAHAVHCPLVQAPAVRHLETEVQYTR